MTFKRILPYALIIALSVTMAPTFSYADDSSSSSDTGTSSDNQDQDQTGTADSTAAPAAPAIAAPTDYDSAIKALAADDYDIKNTALELLGKLADPRAVPVLQALSDDRLSTRPDGSLVYADGDTYKDALTGKVLPDVKKDDLSDVAVNNRVRGTLQGVLGSLSLFSPDPDVRKSAAQSIAGQPTAESAAMLRTALAKETDSGAKAAMETTLASLDLQDPDRTRRLAAIDRLKSSNDPNVQGQLDSMISMEKDADVKKPAQSAVGSIHFRLRLISIGASIFEGLSLGSILLIASIGLSVTFGVMGVINMAHGEMIMLGAYSAFVVQQAFKAWLPPGLLDFYLPVAVPVAFVVAGLVGIALERGVIRFLYGRPLETLLSTWGISLILQQVVRSIFGADNQAVANPSWMTGGIQLIGGFTLTWNRLIIIFFCLLVLAALAALMRFSSYGLNMRAVSQNRPMAAAMGIRTGQVDAFTFGLGSGIAGVAGVALSQIGNVSPNLGQTYIVDTFMVVVFGGVGSLWGTLLGAFSLGMVNKLLEPFAGAILGKIFVLVFIILFIQRRPRGLFALKGRSVEN